MELGSITLLNGEAGAIVVGGTLVACLLGQGARNVAIAARMAGRLVLAPLDEGANRAALARVLYVIQRDGWYAAEAALPPDPDLAKLVAAYLRLGDFAQAKAADAAQQIIIKSQRSAAISTWRAAGELAPVAGLVGTLYAITSLVPDGGAGLAETTAAAVATAAVSTLYGLLFAHLVCLPLAGAIARRSIKDRAVRRRLMDWFADQLPKPRPMTPREPPATIWEEAA